MHEVSLAEGVLQLIEDYQRKEGFCFGSVVRGSVAEGTALEIVEVQGQGWCEACRRSVPMQVRFDSCPDCGHFPLHVSGGTEMRVCELEVE